MGNPDRSSSGGVELGSLTNKPNNHIQIPNRVGNQMISVGTMMNLANQKQDRMNSERIEPAEGLSGSKSSLVSPKLWERTLELQKSNILKRTEIVTSQDCHTTVEID